MTVRPARLRSSYSIAIALILTGGCASDEASLAGPPTTPAATATGSPTSSASPYPFTDCMSLRPGDPLDSATFTCRPEDPAELSTMDCQDGIYVRLVRQGADDLEGLVGRTTTWRTAGPLDDRYGRTEWAFRNCHETDN